MPTKPNEVATIERSFNSLSAPSSHGEKLMIESIRNSCVGSKYKREKYRESLMLYTKGDVETVDKIMKTHEDYYAKMKKTNSKPRV